MPDIFMDKAFDIEHALSMYATSFVTMPAFGIYEEEWIARLVEQISKCHIYIIGSMPKLDFVEAAQKDRDLITGMEVGGKRYDLRWPLPEGVILRGDNQVGWYVEDLPQVLSPFLLH